MGVGYLGSRYLIHPLYFAVILLIDKFLIFKNHSLMLNSTVILLLPTSFTLTVMHLDFNDLKQMPEFQMLLDTVACQGKEIIGLRAQLPAWVPVETACEITGLSATSLWRERKKPNTVIKSKKDHGLRYERASLLAYNQLRTQVKPRGRNLE